MGIRGNVSRNTLANANKVRDWRIYADFAHCLIQKARALYLDEDFGVQLDQTVYAHWMQRLSTCAYQYSPGRIFVRQRLQSSSIRYWIFAAISQRSFI